MNLKFYTERFRNKDSKEIYEIRILRFLDGRLVPAPYSRVSLGHGLIGLFNRSFKMPYKYQLSQMGYTDDEASCKTNVQARLSEAFERGAPLVPEAVKLLKEYHDGLIGEEEIPVSVFAGRDDYTAAIRDFEKKLAEEYKAKCEGERGKCDKEAAEKLDADAARALLFLSSSSSKQAADASLHSIAVVPAASTAASASASASAVAAAPVATPATAATAGEATALAMAAAATTAAAAAESASAASMGHTHRSSP